MSEAGSCSSLPGITTGGLLGDLHSELTRHLVHCPVKMPWNHLISACTSKLLNHEVGERTAS